MRIGAVITAAGMSSRMGDFKPMLHMGSISIAQRIIANFQQADVFPIVVVTGYRATELEKHLSHLGVICVRNPRFESTQMFDSAKIGFELIKDQCSRVFFTPVDIPLFSLDTVQRLMNAEGQAVKPVFGGVEGHPILISTELLPEILDYKGEGGLRGAISSVCGDCSFVAVDDEGILHDADTPEEYSTLLKKNTEQMFRPILDISIVREGKLFDRNAAMLLFMIRQCGTVKSACESIGISYSRAWKMLAVLEENLGFTLVERQPGGESGGASILTEGGEKLLSRYEAYTKEVKRYASSVFKDFFID